ncbi:FAD binding domain-containing protein [Alkaliphilus serpentinus]|uniref:Xanthine dehydrogenase family protein subunit M n=1 Tax=Alkaliphilus serpentinus TaxID=1482731 RepID=A0A833HPB3_9FIRM|nr:xanthine dehydrogenase family protein subunit M [Alkaliphilus serpentinus]KAB3530540.1 xanthine dehydrogenase family protein subunit M [Alkaliphilus serpentinus]
MDIKNVFQAKDVPEAINLLDQYGEAAKVIAGGTDIIIALRENHVKVSVLVDISSIKELKEIKTSDDWVEMGAAVTFTEVMDYFKGHKEYSGLIEAASLVGSPQIRNAATIGGNICNASPAADFVPPLLALDAVLTVEGKEGKREVRLEDFLLDKGRVDLNKGELLTTIKFIRLRKGQTVTFSKLGLRKALAISRLSTAVYLEIDDDEKCAEVRVASGSIGKHGLRERVAEESLKGKNLDKAAIDEASKVLSNEVEKRLAGRSSCEFKKDAVEGIFLKAVEKAMVHNGDGSYCAMGTQYYPRAAGKE